MKIQAIVLAGGSGVRMKADRPKTLIPFLGQPLFVHCLRRMEMEEDIHSIVLVVGNGFENEYRQVVFTTGCAKVVNVVAGGEQRSDSVRNGLAYLDSDADYVVVHDGARPYFGRSAFAAGLQAVREFGAVVLAVPVKSTIKDVDPDTGMVKSTLNRDGLWAVQTPQIFRKEILDQAHAQGAINNPTDDAVLVENLELPVRVIMGDEDNIKITTPQDLLLAEFVLRDKI